MSNLKTLIFTPLFLLSFLASAQNTRNDIDSIRLQYHIPEVSYAVTTDSKILTINTLGLHSINLKDPATLNDRFHLGSNTKAMTAFIIAKYVESGKLKWNTKFFDIFPEWKINSKSYYFNITLEQLLSHRAGIQPFQGDNDPVIPELTGNKREKREKFGKFVLTLDPVLPDENNSFVYSNAGYTLATLMLEKTTGKSWEDLVEKVFNKDLKLNVGFSWPENQIKKDTWGHSFDNGILNPVPSNTDYHLDYTEPAGDLNIKLSDYVKFIQMNIQGLEGQNNYLKAATYNYLHNHFENYSLGWFNIKENNINWSTHSGTAGTYFTLVHIDKTNLLGYIIFTNSFSEETTNGVKLIMRYLKKTYHR